MYYFRTELIRRIKRYETANHKCMIVKYSKDNRYNEGDCVATHDKYTNLKNKTISQFWPLFIEIKRNKIKRLKLNRT
jgi:thymidine kinase